MDGQSYVVLLHSTLGPQVSLAKWGAVTMTNATCPTIINKIGMKHCICGDSYMVIDNACKLERDTQFPYYYLIKPMEAL